MVQQEVLASRGPDDQQGALRSADVAPAPDIEHFGPHRTFAHYDTYEPFDPDGGAEYEPLSRPSTAQSSRSQTPDNTDVDDNGTLADQFEKISLSDTTPLEGANTDAPAARAPRPRYTHINELPIDIMHEILHFLDSTSDLLEFMLVQRRWFGLAVPRIWSRPATGKGEAFEKFCAVLRMPMAEQMHPYAQHITRLSLTSMGPNLRDEHLHCMLQCTNLRRLVLARCSGVSPRAVESVLQSARGLWMLDVDELPIDDAFLSYTALCCPDLQGFYTDSSHITDAGVRDLARLGASLRRIRLKRASAVTPKAVLRLALACPNLVDLDVAELDCFTNMALPPERRRGLSDKDVQDILLQCESLRVLKISGSPRLSDYVLNLRGLRMLRLSNLRELHLSCSPLITDVGVLQITKAAPRLRMLNLSRCVQITDRSLGFVAHAYGPNLEYLHVGHCMNITDRGVITVTEHCPRLWFFDAANCTNLTDHAIIRLARLRHLRRIGVVKCMGITDQSVLAISKNLPGVERLHLSYCSAITQYSITRLLDRCRHIVHLSLTGVPAFMSEEIRRMARSPPEDLSEHQRQVFCVFSQKGVPQLRKYLLEVFMSPGTSGVEQVRRWMQHHVMHMRRTHGAEIPIDQLDPAVLTDMVWRIRNARSNMPGVGEAAALAVDEPENEPLDAQLQPWTNPNMLPVRDGLVRYGPANRNAAEAEQMRLYNEIMAFNERLFILNRHATGGARAGLVGEGTDSLWTTREPTTAPEEPAREQPTQAEPDAGPPSAGPRDEPRSVPQGGRAEPPTTAPPAAAVQGDGPPGEPRAVTRPGAASIAELRERRFRLSFRPRQTPTPAPAPAPTGPLEGTELPPQ